MQVAQTHGGKKYFRQNPLSRLFSGHNSAQNRCLAHVNLSVDCATSEHAPGAALENLAIQRYYSCMSVCQSNLKIVRYPWFQLQNWKLSYPKDATDGEERKTIKHLLTNTMKNDYKQWRRKWKSAAVVGNNRDFHRKLRENGSRETTVDEAFKEKGNPKNHQHTRRRERLDGPHSNEDIPLCHPINQCRGMSTLPRKSEWSGG